MDVTIYHNPRCSKSRQTLALLETRGIEPKVIEYLVAPPDAPTLKAILGKLGIGARDLMRKKEAPYKELGLADTGLTEDALIRAMVENPILMERPVVLAGTQAALGRPPEKVLDIL
jgi:arsenate reductase